MNRKLVVVAALAIASFAGCASAPEQSGSSQANVFTETVVRVAKDGTTTTSSRPITLEQELADNAARARAQHDAVIEVHPAATNGIAPDTVQDFGCAGTDIWVYDQPGAVGNRVCFSGQGFQDLTTVSFYCYMRQCKLVAGNVRSFWPGIDSGYFAYDQSSYCTQGFPAWGAPIDADACGRIANNLALAPIL